MFGRRIAMALSALLLWIQPASSREMKTHPLTVSIHEAVRPTVEAACRQAHLPDIKKCIRKFLKEASDTLRQCKVRFSLKGPVGRFGSRQHPDESPSANITDASKLEEVHQLPADVKIVSKITHCVEEDIQTGNPGCAFRPPNLRKTVIVTVPFFSGHDGILWAHEYGHTAGLFHRFKQGDTNLMTPCRITTDSTDIDEDQCGHFRVGTLPHPTGQGSSDQCPNH
jgi:hypothetical protein